MSAYYLNGGAGEQDTSFSLQPHERLVRLVLGVLQAMSLVAEDEADFALQDSGYLSHSPRIQIESVGQQSSQKSRYVEW